MPLPSLPLGEIARLNPPLNVATPSLEDEVDFFPMAAVDASRVSARASERRPYGEVRKGYTPFVDGDVLLAKITPCFENGKIAQAVVDTDCAFGSTEFHVIRPDPSRMDARYLVHFLRRERVRIDGERKMTGSGGQRRVPTHFLETLPIPVPSLAEQRRIAAILDQADALRAKRREALAQLDRLTQAVFIDMFGDPVGNPRQWPNAAVLGDVADIVSGVTKGRRLNGTDVRPVPYLAVANVQDKSLNLSIVKEIEATEDEITRYRLQRNDLLLTEGGDPDKLGRGTLWQNELPECIHQNHIFRVRLKSDEIHPVFLNWLVGSERGKKYFLRSAKQTTGIASINMTQLRGFPLLVPPMPLQLKFASRLEDLASIRSRQTNALEEMDCLFASLQHRAFRGEL